MKLIVEAGSTKTDSILIQKSDDGVRIKTSSGINPVTDSNYSESIQELAQLYKNLNLTSIHYYGSGCINKEVNNRIERQLKRFLESDVDIEVQDDLLAVGRGLCQQNQGLVVILGTGSNIGFYNGTIITDGIKSCGYLLGDEGSGYRIGQAIYLRFSRNLLSQKDQEMISNIFKISPAESVAKLYDHANPRQFLASFATILKELESEHRSEILNEVFQPFMENMIVPMYQKHEVPIHLSGSIAFHFAEELKHMLKEYNILAFSFVQSPLIGLIKYHTNE